MGLISIHHEVRQTSDHCPSSVVSEDRRRSLCKMLFYYISNTSCAKMKQTDYFMSGWTFFHLGVLVTYSRLSNQNTSCLLINFANSLDQDQVQQNIGTDLDPNV